MAFHPLLFAVFPVLFLLRENLAYTSYGELGRSLAAVLALCAAAWAVAGIVARNAAKAALLTSLFLFVFFLLGRVLEDGSTLGFAAAGLGAAWVAGSAAVLRARSIERAAAFATSVGVVLVAMNLTGLVVGAFRHGATPPPAAQTGALPAASELARHAGARPDIYYIVLDGYARGDVLKERFGYDDEPFLASLRAQGFFVADRSVANYPQTLLSLASTLNVRYLDAEDARNIRARGRKYLRDLILQNAVVERLKGLGYEVYCFESGYVGTQLEADVIVSAGPALNEPELNLLNTTVLPHLAGALQAVRAPGGATTSAALDSFEAHRGRVLHTLDAVAKLPVTKHPKFVFAHVLSPHPPFVFDAGGKPVKQGLPLSFGDGSHFYKNGLSRGDYRRLYRDQVAHVNRQVSAAVTKILATAQTPPVIVVQADHGPGSGLDWESEAKSDLGERFGILNAYYAPAATAALSREISPVNTFRVLFNAYFGAGVARLDERSYFATWSEPWRFTEVTGKLGAR
jgi:hypothetical protein